MGTKHWQEQNIGRNKTLLGTKHWWEQNICGNKNIGGNKTLVGTKKMVGTKHWWEQNIGRNKIFRKCTARQLNSKKVYYFKNIFILLPIKYSTVSNLIQKTCLYISEHQREAVWTLTNALKAKPPTFHNLHIFVTSEDDI